MTSSALFSRCRAVFSALAFAAVILPGCATDDDLTCTGGRVESGGACKCPGADQEFREGACVHIQGRLPKMYTNLVDRGGSTGVGIGMALDAANYPHITYLEFNNLDLRYATLDKKTARWKIENVDVAGEVGLYPALALADRAGTPRPAVVYYDQSEQSLKGAYRSADGWVRKFLDPRQPEPSMNRGTHASIAVFDGEDGSHVAHIAYLDALNFDLYYLRWNLDKPDDVSRPRLVDSGFSLVAGQAYGSGIIDDATGIAVDSLGRPVISYRDAKNGDLKVAAYDDAKDAWTTTFVDNDPLTQLNYEDLGEYSSIAVDKIDNYHVAYFDRTYGAVKYALYDGSEWTTESVDHGQVGYFASIAVREDRSPVIAYFDQANASVKVAHKRRDGTWQIEVVANYGISGQFVRLALTDLEWPAVAYREVNTEALYFDYILTVFP